MTVHFPFQNSYAALPANFFARVAPTPVATPRLIKLNRPLAVHLGLDPDLLDTPEGAEILAGKTGRHCFRHETVEAHGLPKSEIGVRSNAAIVE